ncbi:MAG: prepilin peptidase [Patescibacteria group bacterium]|nr:prepilin peptidase [Patescibacteria group bacterium]
MNSFFWIILFGLGMALGSFLNVLIFRYDPCGKLFNFKRLNGRSHCPQCRENLCWFDLIPLFSFLFLLGRCRYCKKQISWQYPIVEFLSGVIFIAVPLFLNRFYWVSNLSFSSLELSFWYYVFVFCWIAVFLLFLAMSVIDFRDYVIPDEINLFLAILGIAITIFLTAESGLFPRFDSSFLGHYALMFSFFDNIILNRILCSLFIGLLFSALSILSRGRAMGFGDAKLAFAVGLIFGWPDIILAVMLAFILGGLVGLGLIVFRGKNMRDKLPFAPFFVVGMILTFFLGFTLISSYFNLFNFLV